jgi:hypothetical protein
MDAVCWWIGLTHWFPDIRGALTDLDVTSGRGFFCGFFWVATGGLSQQEWIQPKRVAWCTSGLWRIHKNPTCRSERVIVEGRSHVQPCRMTARSWRQVLARALPEFTALSTQAHQNKHPDWRNACSLFSQGVYVLVCLTDAICALYEVSSLSCSSNVPSLTSVL